MLEGFPVETQFNTPFAMAAAEAALWRGDRTSRSRPSGLASREIRTASGPAYHVRLLRLGDARRGGVAEVARARRDPAGERRRSRPATTCGTRCSRSSSRRRRRRGHGRRRDRRRGRDDRGRTPPPASRAGGASWADAAARWRAREKPYLVAYCRWREAEARLEDGDRVGAAGPRRGERASPRVSVPRPSQAIEGLAARSRLDLSTEARRRTRPRSRPADDPFGLTRRERDVLPLLVKGRTNRQIAEELFISENTAGVHVSNILGKLGATTRTEAAGIAARLGLGLDEG